MGVTTDEPYGNIAFLERIEKHWYYNKSVLYSFKYDIYEVVVLPLQSEGAVILKLEILKAKSNKTLLPTDSVYQYFNLYSGSKHFNNVTIKFRVDPTWASTMSSIVLQRWNGNAWDTLETNQISANVNWVYFEAHTNAFSNFAVVGIPKTIELPVVPVTTTIVPTPTETEIKPIEEPSDISLITIIFMIIGTLIVIALLYWMYKNRNG